MVKKKQLLPLSIYQKMFFLEWVLNPGSSAYNIAFAYKIKGQLNKALLKKSCETLMENHEILHAVFSKNGDKCFYGEFSIDDLYQEYDLKEKETPREWITKLAQKSFNLTEGPLIYFYFIEDKKSNVYYFTVSAHHIIVDALTIGIIAKEISNGYNKLLAGKAYHSSIQSFIEAVKSEKAEISKVDESQSSVYWKNLLSEDVSLNLDLPSYAEASVGHQSKDPYIHFELTEKEISHLKSLITETEATTFLVLSALFGVVLSKFSSQEKFAISYPMNMRSKTFSNTPGSFVNNAPFVFDMDKVETVGGLINDLKRQREQGKGHYSYLFPSLIHDLRKSRKEWGQSYFNVSIAATRFAADFSLDGLEIEPINIVRPSTHDLLFQYDAHQDNRLTCILSYDPNKVDRCLAQKVSQSLRGLLQKVDLKNIQIRQYCPLSEKEYNQVVYDWNKTEAPYPKEKMLHQLFEAQVEKTPNHTALIFKDKKMTYAELNARANHLAQVIKDVYQKQFNAEVTPNTLIGLYINRSFEMIISILAIFKAGCAYVPISPTFPEERTEYILNDIDAKLIITQSCFLDKLNEYIANFSKKIALIPADNLKTTKQRAVFIKNPEPINTPNDLAYVIYTSGTTGNPKGVMLSHKGVVNRIHWMQKEYELTPLDRVLQKTPFMFDVSVWELLWANWVGAAIVIAEPDAHKDPEALDNLVRKMGVTTLHFVPSMLDVFLQYLDEFEKKLPKSIRQVFCSGEALTMSSYRTFKKISIYGAALHNLYGPTEASIDVTYYECEESDRPGMPIGRAIDNTKLFVLDSGNQPVGIGTLGELYLGGIGLAKGYLNRTSLTKEKFVDNAFATKLDKEKGYTKLYKTGDIVRWLPDGNLEYIGRNDFQVKIRGFRIELGEIESTLTKIEGIKQAVVVDRKRPDGSKYLAAYVVSNHYAFDDERLRKELGKHLPDYMVPATFTKIESVPLTINGKLDRKALPEPELIHQESYVRPTNELEEKMCILWQEALSLKQVGIEDNFFSIGGDSLVAVHLAHRINQEGLNVGVGDIFKNPTVSSLIKCIIEPKNQHICVTVNEEFLLYPMQKYFFSWAKHNPNHFNMNACFASKLIENQSTLEEAFRLVLEGRTSLRLRFKKDGKGDYSQYYSSDNQSVVIENFLLQPDEDMTEIIMQRTEIHQSKLDIEHGPLIRVLLFNQVDSNVSYISIIFHHLIIDGFSLPTVIGDLVYYYNCIEKNEPITLRTDKLPYKNLIEINIKNLDKIPNRLIQDYIHDIDQTMQPPNNKIAKQKDFEEITATLCNLETIDQIRNSIKNFNEADIFSLCLSQANLILNGQENTLIHFVHHGRNLFDLTGEKSLIDTVGWCTEHLPVNLKSNGIIDSADNLRVNVKSIKQSYQILDSGIHFAFQRYYAASSAIRDKLSHFDRVNILFNYAGDTSAGLYDNHNVIYPGDKLRTIKNRVNANNDEDYLLYFYIYKTQTNYELMLRYSNLHYDRSYIVELLEHFNNTIDCILSQSSGNGKL